MLPTEFFPEVLVAMATKFGT